VFAKLNTVEMDLTVSSKTKLAFHENGAIQEI
jgi:hypothetical protein